MSKTDQQAAGAQSRPIELEDWLNRRIYHPLSWRLARALSHTPLTPNMVSVAGGLTVVLAALIYANTTGPAWAALGMLVHMSWHVLDGADGDLARMTGRVSPMGEIVDGLCDYLSHLVLYVALGSVLAGTMGIWGWVLMAAAGFARIAQTVFYETQRRQYQWWIYGTGWVREQPRQDGWLSGAAAFYLRLVSFVSTNGEALDKRFEQADEAESERLRAGVTRHVLPVVSRLGVFSSNIRTVLIGLAMIVGQPILIVVLELLALVVLLPLFLRLARNAIAAVLAQPDASSSR